MRKQLVFAAFCILGVPLLFSTSQTNRGRTTAPFATVAFAGHTSFGNWCECGEPGCICDPGEILGRHMATQVSDGKSSDHALSPIHARSQSGSDFGTGTLLVALALFLWARLRA